MVIVLDKYSAVTNSLQTMKTYFIARFFSKKYHDMELMDNLGFNHKIHLLMIV